MARWVNFSGRQKKGPEEMIRAFFLFELGAAS
jgi:hypothetical protein